MAFKTKHSRVNSIKLSSQYAENLRRWHSLHYLLRSCQSRVSPQWEPGVGGRSPSAAASRRGCFLRLLRDERAGSQGKPRLGPHSARRRDCEGCYFVSEERLSASHGWLSSLIPVGLACHGGKSNSARRFPPLATLTKPHLALFLPRSLHLF